MKKILTQLYCVVTFIALTFSAATAQVTSGAAFLNMQPGSRAQAMGGAYTAIVDDPHVLFTNPAGVGFMQEWQWSASYSKWIADIYNTSFIYGRRIGMPWSRNTHFAFGISYQGMPEFDSSAGLAPVAGSSDMVASFSIGQPLSFFSQNLSVGANFKYLNSTLAEFTASTLVTDLGLMWKSQPFNLGNSLFPQAVLSLGGAVTQRGGDLTYDAIGTPLPATTKIGTALYLGSYDGLRLTVSADYVNIKDVDPYIALGGELMINQLLAINAGYNMGNDLLGKMTFGISLKLDGKSGMSKAFPGKQNSVRLDFATLDGSDYFSRPYQGTITHQNTAPQEFHLTETATSDTSANKIKFTWEKAQDNDVFDKVNYTVIADRDSVKIRNLLDRVKQDVANFEQLTSEEEFDLLAETSNNEMELANANGGKVYWTVAATDLSKQVRINSGEKINVVTVPQPDIEILDVRFAYLPYITNDDYQGTVNITLKNNGMQPIENVDLFVKDRVIRLDKVLPLSAETNNKPMQMHIASLAAEEIKIVELPWYTRQLGEHEFTVEVKTAQMMKEANDKNNVVVQNFYTIPKGVFTSADTAVVYSEAKSEVDLPFITQITFDVNSTKVKNEYLHRTFVEPYLDVLAKRMVENPKLKISLKGYVDSNSEERDINLANARALAVRDSLLNLGVQVNQIVIAPGEVLAKRAVPKDPQDAKWVFEERRYVQISSDFNTQAILFAPVSQKSMVANSGSINFNADVTSSIPIDFSHVEIDGQKVNCKFGNTPEEKTLSGCSVTPSSNELKSMMQKSLPYELVLVDSEGRKFQTYPQQVFVMQKKTTNEQRYGVPLEFGKINPIIHNYFEEMYQLVIHTINADEKAVIRFEGHACAIGSAQVNKTLSEKRAESFHNAFLAFVLKNHKGDYQKIKARMQHFEGYGESRPFTFETATGKNNLVGDNNSSIGRKLNRRIEMVIYRK